MTISRNAFQICHFNTRSTLGKALPSNHVTNRRRLKGGSSNFQQISWGSLDFEPDSPCTLILGRSFLKTSRALIDVYEGEITLRVGREAITFNLDQTSRYTANYNHMTANLKLTSIDLACEDYFKQFLIDLIVFDPADGDILLLEAILNSDPSPPPNQGNYLPEIRKDLKICEANNEKSSVNEPPEVELKDLPPHLILHFGSTTSCRLYHQKILMEEDYEPTVQHQRRVNPKIHDVIKKEVEKLLDAGLIYPISDSPWNSMFSSEDKKGAEESGRDNLSRLKTLIKLKLGEQGNHRRNIPLGKTHWIGCTRVDSTHGLQISARYHARELHFRECHPQQQNKFFNDVKPYFWG
ncbi:hypothetical protein Tco_0776327 [Tanacetum coccineum]